jgi:hypothetical protein
VGLQTSSPRSVPHSGLVSVRERGGVVLPFHAPFTGSYRSLGHRHTMSRRRKMSSSFRSLTPSLDSHVFRGFSSVFLPIQVLGCSCTIRFCWESGKLPHWGLVDSFLVFRFPCFVVSCCKLIPLLCEVFFSLLLSS